MAFGVSSASSGDVDVPGEFERAADQVANGDEHGGVLRALTWDLFSLKPTSRAKWAVFSTVQCPLAHAAISAAMACSARRSVTTYTVSLDHFFPTYRRRLRWSAGPHGRAERAAVDGDDLDGTLLVAAVAAGVIAVDHGDLLPGRPGGTGGPDRAGCS